MSSSLAGICSVHPLEQLRVEWADGMYAVCMLCPRRIALCGTTRYMAPCIMELGHVGEHLDDKGNKWECAVKA